MDQNQIKKIKELANEFFQAAREYVCNMLEKKEPLSMFSGDSFRIRGPLLGMDDNVREKQEVLVRQCIRSLGVELGSEEEIEKLAWDYVWQSLSNINPISDTSEITKQFLGDITCYKQHSYGYLAPNYAIKFSGQVQKIVIGPVEVMQTKHLVKDQKEIPKDKTIWEKILAGEKIPLEIQVGSKFDWSISNNRILMELSETCWYIPMGSIKAARRNFEEKAIWSINVAISLLRLCYPNLKHSKYPRVGDIEEMPLTEPKKFWLDGRRDEKGLVLGKGDKSTNRPIFSMRISAPVSSSVRRIPCIYVVDDEVVERTEEQKFKDRAQEIFDPAKNSLAERFGQGLGWLSRGRQTVDRAERFLFFFTAIEALLSSNDKSAPVVQTISRYAATILYTDSLERENFAGRLRSLYEVRSTLVHAGKRNVSQAQSMEAQRAAEELYKAVMENYPLDSKFDEFQKSLAKASYGSPWPSSKLNSASSPTTGS